MSNELQIMVDAEATLSVAKEFVIDCLDMYQAAGEELKSIKSLQKRVESARKEAVAPLDKKRAELQALYKKPADVLAQAEKLIKGAMLTYQDELEREERRKRIEAEKNAAAERARLEAEAAAMREEVAKAEARGDVQAAAEAQVEAEFVASIAETTTAVAHQKVDTKVSGISSKKTYKAEVTDLLALIKHVAANPDLVDLIAPNQVAINKMCGALKQHMKIPGITVNEVKGIASRAA